MSGVISPAETLGFERLPATLSVAQTATLLGISRQSVYRAANAGEIKSLKVRGRLVIATQPLVDAMGW